MVKITGVLGWPVSHSLSPLMHNRAIEILELDYTYLPFEVPPDSLEKAVKGLGALGVCGVNLTIPHKEKVIPFLDRLSPEAEQAGAVNTVCFKNGEMSGHNTDGQGFIRSLREEGVDNFPDKSILVIGAGGAARGICTALASEGTGRITISNRNAGRGEDLAALIRGFAPNSEVKSLYLSKLSAQNIGSFDIIINTTSVGMKRDDPPLFDYNLIANKHTVCDIIYTPPKTTLLTVAEAKGAMSVNGLGMLIYQGALSFELWTGVSMPIQQIKETLVNHMQKSAHGQN